MSGLPADREKALAAIAAGWGRTATAAHPLCTCAEPTPYPSFMPPCSRCGAGENERCRQPGQVCGTTSYGRGRRRIAEYLAEHACPVHAAHQLTETR